MRDRGATGSGADGLESARSRRRGLLHLFVWGLFLIVLYALSIGPAFRLFEKGVVNVEFIETVYMPLFAVGKHYASVERLIDWYVFDVWGFQPPVRSGVARFVFTRGGG